MAELQVYIKEYNDSEWTDITDRVVKTDFKLRSGFSTLGGSINLSKLDITYRASDLAVAAIFHTTAKQIRINKDGATIWEGYSEGSSSVTPTVTSSLAWVRISAYPYLHAFEEVESENDETYFNVFISNPNQESVSLLHILWSKMVAGCLSPFGDAIEREFTVNFPTISAQRSIAVIEEGESYLSIFNEILKEYGYVITLDGFDVNFVQPYSDDFRSIYQIPYSAVESNPTIKSAPYEAKTQPVVTLTRIVTMENCRVYSLAESDEENAEEELYIGASHPEEGEYEEVSYSNADLESDTFNLIYAKNPSLTYKARYSDDSADAILQADVLELGSTSAKIKLTNTNTELSCYLNQLWIDAEKVYFEDTSLQLTSAVKNGKKAEETTKWLSYEAHATAYINALIAEQKASTSSLKFKSTKLGDTYKPNDLIKLGDIGAVYIIKQVDENIATEEREYTCGIFSLSSSASVEYKKKGESKRGPKGDKGEEGEAGTSPVTCDISQQAITLPADEDGLVSATYYSRISIVLAVKQLYEGVYTNLLASELATTNGTFQVGVVCPDITNWTMTGNEFKCGNDSVMLKDTAEIKFTVTCKDFMGNTGTFIRYTTVTKVYAGQPASLYFAWSSSQTEFIPKPPKFFVRSGLLFGLNRGLLGKFPVPKEWLSNTDVYQYKDDVYKYLWCKTSLDGTPFLFTGISGGYVLYQYALGDSEGNEPAEDDWRDTMPDTLIGSGGFLWVRTQTVPSGGTPSEDGWGTPVIAGSDNVEVYQRIAANEASIATIVKSADALEARVTKIDGTDGSIERLESSITQTADTISARITKIDGEDGSIKKLESSITQSAGKIALRVDGTDVVDPAGIVVGTLDNKGVISLTASKILLNGSVTASLIDIANLLATDAFIKKLKAQNLVISNSSGMSVEIRSTDDNGSLLSPPVFRIAYNGSNIFRVNPSTGYVYIYGTGVLNDAEINNAEISNAIISGKLDGATGTFSGQFDTPALRTEPNPSSGTTYSVTLSASGNKTYSTADIFNALVEFYEKFNETLYVKLSFGTGNFIMSRTKSSTSVLDGCFKFKAVGYNNWFYIEKRYGNYYYNYESHGLSPFIADTNYIDYIANNSWTITYTANAGDKLFLKDIQIGSNGLETNQVYRDENGFLKIVT